MTLSFCEAVDSYGNAFIYDGVNWSAPQTVDSGDDLLSIACPTTTFCAVVGTNGNATEGQ